MDIEFMNRVLNQVSFGLYLKITCLSYLYKYKNSQNVLNWNTKERDTLKEWN